MSDQTSENTIQISYSSIYKGFPIVNNGDFISSLETALEGGDSTQVFFDELNKTGTFWAAISDKLISFVPGESPNGEPVIIASDGNVDMRISAFYSGATDLSQPLGNITVELGNKQTKITQLMAYHINITAMPSSVPIGKELFEGLRQTIYNSFSDMIQNLAAQLALDASVEDPNIHPSTTIVSVLAAASSKVVGLAGSLAEFGLKYLVANFNEMAFSMAVCVPLIAIPLVFGYLAHEMYTSVMVVNQTNMSFGLKLEDLIHGKSSVDWPISTLYGQSKVLLPVTPDSGDMLSQMAAAQYINVNTWGSIGLVLSTTSEGGQESAQVIAVPWAGTNSIWVGTPDATPGETYSNHSAANSKLFYSQNCDGFTVKLAINKLSGKTNGVYWYGVLIAILPT